MNVSSSTCSSSFSENWVFLSEQSTRAAETASESVNTVEADLFVETGLPLGVGDIPLPINTGKQIAGLEEKDKASKRERRESEELLDEERMGKKLDYADIWRDPTKRKQSILDSANLRLDVQPPPPGCANLQLQISERSVACLLVGFDMNHVEDPEKQREIIRAVRFGLLQSCTTGTIWTLGTIPSE